MAAIKVRNLWTAFFTALVALLASVGLTTVASAAQQSAVQTPERTDLPRQTRTEAVRGTVPAQSTRWSPTVRDRSLPPTIKQRISAEAHGSSPATRHLSAESDDAAIEPGSDALADRALTSA
ncbi:MULTISPECIES: DUF6344 domain-containing protein [unclassified Streptomyces]|uniref:DUF6344 domain-containing protein n=1 Tax=unclassified Streptomyces TaxID=2593676 RepID=UPI0028C421A4|nr:MULTISPECIES: DUF6344 domain-containing protein [unclassified Streptomyces]WNO73524.1 DUF6344 domain-containing protein [Streptomyces sp. AM8-1-1]